MCILIKKNSHDIPSKNTKNVFFFLITYIHLLVYTMPLSTFHCGTGEEGEDSHLTLFIYFFITIVKDIYMF